MIPTRKLEIDLVDEPSDSDLYGFVLFLDCHQVPGTILHMRNLKLSQEDVERVCSSVQITPIIIRGDKKIESIIPKSN